MKSQATAPAYWVWLDLEMTGLDPTTDTILEIATVITDTQLKVIAEGPDFAIHHPDSILDNMNEWCQKQHGLSGLVQRVKESKITLAEAESQTLAFLRQHVPAGTSPLCGNTISQDRRFLYKYMPTLERFFHYRNLDVSTVKILAQQWKPTVLEKVSKNDTHLALADVYESIAELKIYRQGWLVS